MLFRSVPALRRRLLSTVAESGKKAVNGTDLFYMRNGAAGLPIICMTGALGGLPSLRCGSLPARH